MKIRHQAVSILGLTFLLFGFILLKFGSEYLRSHQSYVEAKTVNRECELIESELDHFVEQNGRLPESLVDLKLADLPISIDQFRYTNNTNECVIAYRSDKVNVAYPRHYSAIPDPRNRTK
jgi:hypothetical protein